MPDCVFCRIASRELPAEILFEDEHSLVFTDMNPQAPVHLLVIPRRHLENLEQAEGEEGGNLLAHLFSVAVKSAADAQLTRGYRIVVNTGADGGQAVEHLHLHVLGGRALTWPPG